MFLFMYINYKYIWFVRLIVDLFISSYKKYGLQNIGKILRNN